MKIRSLYKPMNMYVGTNHRLSIHRQLSRYIQLKRRSSGTVRPMNSYINERTIRFHSSCNSLRIRDLLEEDSIMSLRIGRKDGMCRIS